MNINDFNTLSQVQLQKELFSCCGSERWGVKLMDQFPFDSVEDLVLAATRIWYTECKKNDWLHAFGQHPKIGDLESSEKKFKSTQHLAGKEQDRVAEASTDTLLALQKENKTYENQNGFIFIVYASGRSAKEMLRLLQDRLKNSPEEELHIAMGEQHKITLLRLQKLLSEENWSFLKPSQLTTHVLDTSLGKPGEGMSIKLQEMRNGSWQIKAQGVTNADGRISDLLPPHINLSPQSYRMVFETGDYFEQHKLTGFYPQVEIQFSVFDDKHYHVPLLINPFGYSTYRGS